MLGLWLTLIGITVLYFISTGFWFFFVRSGMNIDDSKKIDPIPTDREF